MLKEANVYIDNIKKKFGTFNHAPLKSAINPELLAQHTQQMIPGTGISCTIDPVYNNDEGAEVTSSSNDSGSTSGTGSSNSSMASTKDSSVNSQNENAVESHSPDPVDIEEQPAKKKARLSIAADNGKCIPMDQSTDNNVQKMVCKLEAATAEANQGAAISPELILDQVRNENVRITQHLKQMSDQLNEKALENEQLKLANQALTDENEQLKNTLEEKTAQINQIEADQHETPQRMDRIALIELAKKTKICMGCNAESPLDMLHFCGVGCQKSYL